MLTKGGKEMADNDDKILSSEALRTELNKERAKEGLYEVPAVNPRNGGNVSTLARKDKSFDNAADFFSKLVKMKKQRRKGSE